jgi:hypothetical protein
MDKLTTALDDVRSSKFVLYAVVETLPGKWASWLKCGRRCSGLIEKSFMGSVKVTNAATGSTYWVRASDIISVEGNV